MIIVYPENCNTTFKTGYGAGWVKSISIQNSNMANTTVKCNQGNSQLRSSFASSRYHWYLLVGNVLFSTCGSKHDFYNQTYFGV